MTKRLIILITILLGLTAFTANAQMYKNVQWRMTIKLTSATEGVATLKAIIDDGYHMYGTKPVKGGPIATVIDFNKSLGVKLIGEPIANPAPSVGIDTLFDIKLSWWSGVVTFKQKFKVTDRAKARINCDIKYQTCDNNRCSMPVKETLSKTLPK